MSRRAPAKPRLDPPFRRPASQLAMMETQNIYCGDNLQKLREMPEEWVDLVYIDPPFNSNRVYETFWGETKEKRAFDDRHESTKAYIEFMRPRCVELARVMKKTGSFYYHCDWHASHYVKVMLDQIFGENGFRNEIIWRRATAKTQSYACFPNNHDSIFFYAPENATFNRQFRPLSDERIGKHYSLADPDGRKYSLSDLTGEGLRNGLTGTPWRGFDPNTIGRHWGRPPSDLDTLDANGLIYWPAKPGAWPRMKRYLDEMSGVQVDTIWDDISPLNAKATERLGYPTQKPLALMERIIKASSDEDDIVLDAFCGCGTALVAAQRLDRRWVGIDCSPTACRVMSKRLADDCHLREGVDFLLCDMPRSETELRQMPPFEFQNWAVVALGGIPNRRKSGDKGIDGHYYPVAEESKKGAKDGDSFEFMKWYPVQVKQRDKAGRPDIDAFETAIQREEKKKGIFVSFDYSSEALEEIRGFYKRSGCVIVPITVRELLATDATELAMKLA